MSTFNKAPNCNTIPCPCYNCDKRESGCHSTCKRFERWKYRFDEAMKKEKSESTSVFTQWSYTHKKGK